MIFQDAVIREMKRVRVRPAQPTLTLSSPDLPNHCHEQRGVAKTHVILGRKGASQRQKSMCGKKYPGISLGKGKMLRKKSTHSTVLM